MLSHAQADAQTASFNPSGDTGERSEPVRYPEAGRLSGILSHDRETRQGFSGPSARVTASGGAGGTQEQPAKPTWVSLTLYALVPAGAVATPPNETFTAGATSGMVTVKQAPPRRSDRR